MFLHATTAKTLTNKATTQNKYLRGYPIKVKYGY